MSSSTDGFLLLAGREGAIGQDSSYERRRASEGESSASANGKAVMLVQMIPFMGVLRLALGTHVLESFVRKGAALKWTTTDRAAGVR